MDALEDVFVDEVLTVHCHENGDCQEPYDRHSERSRVVSELPQAAGDFQSETLTRFVRIFIAQTS